MLFYYYFELTTLTLYNTTIFSTLFCLFSIQKHKTYNTVATHQLHHSNHNTGNEKK